MFLRDRTEIEDDNDDLGLTSSFLTMSIEALSYMIPIVLFRVEYLVCVCVRMCLCVFAINI